MRLASQCALLALPTLLGLSSACSRAPTQPSSAPPPVLARARPALTPSPEAAAAAPPESAAPEPAPPRPPLPGGTFVIGGPEGIVEVGFDGNVQRTLTKTPAARPRFAPGGRDVLFIVPGQYELRVVSRDGRERILAKLPIRKGCARSDEKLSVHEDNDFIVDPKKGVACLRLMDRNANMASVGVNARVELASQKVKSAVSFSRSCPKDEKAEALFDCAIDIELYHNGKPPGPAAARAGLHADFRVESLSPSERWAVVTGNIQEGDYIHRDLYLLDTSAGGIYPVVKGAWPAPTSADKLTSAAPDATVDVVGESTIRWLGIGDWLLVDNLLIEPGQQVSELPGDVAR